MCWLGTQNEGFSLYLQMLSSYQTTILNCSEEYAADLLIYSYPSQNTACLNCYVKRWFCLES